MRNAAGTVLPEMEFQDLLVRTVQANIEAENTYVPRDKVIADASPIFTLKILVAHQPMRITGWTGRK